MRRLLLHAHNLRLLAEQRLADARLAYLVELQRITGSAVAVTAEEEVLFTHPDLIELDLADAYWRPR